MGHDLATEQHQQVFFMGVHAFSQTRFILLLLLYI